MKQDSSRRTHRLLVFGVIFLLLGGSLLLRTTGNLPGAFSLCRPPWYSSASLFYTKFFSGTAGKPTSSPVSFSCSWGRFLLILNTHAFDVKFRQIWPFFMLFAGVSLLVYGFKRPKSSRARMMIPAFSIILLSGVLSSFSAWISSPSASGASSSCGGRLYSSSPAFSLIGFDFFSNRKPGIRGVHFLILFTGFTEIRIDEKPPFEGKLRAAASAVEAVREGFLPMDVEHHRGADQYGEEERDRELGRGRCPEPAEGMWPRRGTWPRCRGKGSPDVFVRPAGHSVSGA